LVGCFFLLHLLLSLIFIFVFFFVVFLMSDINYMMLKQAPAETIIN
jgi:hypothetical protein